MDIVPPLKRCTKCGEEKPATSEFFYQRNNGTLKPSCKECELQRGREWYEKNREKKLAQNQAWFDKHPDKRNEYSKRWLETHPERAKEVQRNFRLKHRDEINANLRAYHHANKDKLNQDRRDYYYTNIDKEKSRYARYKAENADKIKKRQAEYREENRELLRERVKACDRKHADKRKAYRDEHREDIRRRSRENYLKNRDRVLERTRKRHRDNPKLAVVAAERRLARVRSLPSTLTNEQWETALNYWGHKCAVCGRSADFWNVIAADHWTPITSPNCPGTTHLNIVPLCHSRKDGEGGCNNSKSNRDPVEFVTSRLGERKAKKKLAEIEAFFKWMYDKYTSEGDAE